MNLGTELLRVEQLYVLCLRHAHAPLSPAEGGRAPRKETHTAAPCPCTAGMVCTATHTGSSYVYQIAALSLRAHLITRAIASTTTRPVRVCVCVCRRVHWRSTCHINIRIFRKLLGNRCCNRVLRLAKETG